MRNIETFISNSQESHESKEEKEISIIEKSLLDSDKKLDLVLLSLDRKRVTILGNYSISETEKEKEETVKEFTEELEELKKTLTELGYYYDEDGVGVEDEVIIGFSIVVSKKEEYLSKIMDVKKKDDDKEIGLLLGYPPTAVDSYNSEKAMDFEHFFYVDLSEEERKQFREEGILKFLGFMPSKEHWKEELEEVRENQILVKEKAPHLYEAIMATEDVL